ncbi:Eco57I restriction-modification methylase domain-containing protein [Tomitella biformata]|uniref:Eco57I restriction-modification methylase domain-containing protein n=1 Tax=Tomitella biformata TaxID=630403 RepID=UPI0004661619|nr:restriction endonuclease subunit M [Tomitella biformata]
MATFDSIVIGEDWISEHYFTTDSTKESFHGRVLALRKLWDAEAKAGRSTVRSDLLAAAGDLQATLAGLSENPDGASAAHAKVRSALGFPGELSTYAAERSGSELEIRDAQLSESANLLFLQAQPVASIEDLQDPDTGQLLIPAMEDGKPMATVWKAVSAAFRSDTPPAFVVVQAGQWLMLAEAERWAEGRYLAMDLLVVTERRHEARGGEIDRAAAMFGRQALMSDADGNIWWTETLEDSVKHTVGVSKDLREGIRLSIEIIANEVVRRRAAKGLSLDDIDGQDLAKHSLRFLYRILFLLYAEASPEMRVLPSGAAEYEEGYGLDRLRELTLSELVSAQARSGTHLYESLSTLFRLVDKGHSPVIRTTNDGAAVDDPAPGLEFQSLRADLFAPKSTALIDEVGLGNEATQQVLEHLLLSKESKGRGSRNRERGFISYAELGINQLGAVYEGLMSYTGFFAEEDLYEVAKNGDPEKGSWVVPTTRAEHLSPADFVRTVDEATGEDKPVIHEKGTFVYRLAGRERQQSASYYTPEVLTRFVVSQSLEELLDQDGVRTTPEQILDLTICEPALGSGAFAIEAVRQLAAEYLKRRQEDLGELIDADQYPIELQKVKAYLALHQVYGVDLNATAVELAEISLWLDTMVAGLQAPWFGLHLRRGNSLIGARRSVYAPSLLAKGQWLRTPAKDVHLGQEISTGIHHFLLPSEGWGAAIEVSEARKYAPDQREELRLWRNEIRKAPSKAIVKRLAALAQRVETLWDFTLRRLTIAESEIRRDIHLWGAEPIPHIHAVTREEIEVLLSDPNSAYQRLRSVMDAWCAMWWWPLTTDIEPPDWDQWVGGLEAIIGTTLKPGKFEKYGQTTLSNDMSWNALGIAEDTDITFSQAIPMEKAMTRFPWLMVSAEVAEAQGFFHWELDFSPIFTQGGFNLQVGNPPWVRPDWDEARVLAEYDPAWVLQNNTVQAEIEHRRTVALSDPEVLNNFLNEAIQTTAFRSFLTSPPIFPIGHGGRPDLYRSFIETGWRNQNQNGVLALVHPATHLTAPNLAQFRKSCYIRLTRMWHFQNKLRLFDIDSKEEYSVSIYGNPTRISFSTASFIFHPSTIERSLTHDGSGPVPGMSNIDNKPDLSPHSHRLFHISESVVQSWSELFDDQESDPHSGRMQFLHNQQSASVIEKMARTSRIHSIDPAFNSGWNETTSRRDQIFDFDVIEPRDWEDSILLAANISPCNPFSSEPNPDPTGPNFRKIDLMSLPVNAVPNTRYSRKNSRELFQSRFFQPTSSDQFSAAWREWIKPSNERALQPALLPPGTTHVNAILSLQVPGSENIMVATIVGLLSSIPMDFLAKTANKTHLAQSLIRHFPIVTDHPLIQHLILRTLRLNCLVQAYSPIWEELYRPSWLQDSWVPNICASHSPVVPLSDIQAEWRPETPLRSDADRRQALIEIDAIVAVMIDITSEELLTIYKTQFPILQKYDRQSLFDATGRQLPTALASEHRRTGSAGPSNLTVDGVTYLKPFAAVNREQDLILAHQYFSKQLEHQRLNLAH